MLRWPICQIVSSYFVHDHAALKHISAVGDHTFGEAFATYHRPKHGDLNTGFSFVSMLDGHVQKVTAADQLRQSNPSSTVRPQNRIFRALILGPMLDFRLLSGDGVS